MPPQLFKSLQRNYVTLNGKQASRKLKPRNIRNIVFRKYEIRKRLNMKFLKQKESKAQVNLIC